MKRCLAIVILAGLLSGCGLQSSDRYGIYADGENFIAVNHAAARIQYATDATPAETLLSQTRDGQGLTFTTWRDKTSCGLSDSAGNVFAVPRGQRYDRDNAIFTVEPEAPVYEQVNNAPVGSKVIALRTDNLVRVRYLYDDSLGIRWIDQYAPDGQFDRRIWLERGVGLLEHCRGKSVDDYKG